MSAQWVFWTKCLIHVLTLPFHFPVLPWVTLPAAYLGCGFSVHHELVDASITVFTFLFDAVLLGLCSPSSGFHNSPFSFSEQIYYTQTCKDLNLQVIYVLYYILLNDSSFSSDLTVWLQSRIAFPEIKYYNVEKHIAKKAKNLHFTWDLRTDLKS